RAARRNERDRRCTRHEDKRRRETEALHEAFSLRGSEMADRSVLRHLPRAHFAASLGGVSVTLRCALARQSSTGRLLLVKQKGAAIRGTLRALATLHGDGALAAVKAALRPEVRSQIEPVVLATSWYPIEVSAAIHAAIREIVGRGSWAASHAIGYEAA